jgi:hypothetical protein
MSLIRRICSGSRIRAAGAWSPFSDCTWMVILSLARACLNRSRSFSPVSLPSASAQLLFLLLQAGVELGVDPLEFEFLVAHLQPGDELGIDQGVGQQHLHPCPFQRARAPAWPASSVQYRMRLSLPESRRLR